MGFYRDNVAPRLINRACGIAELGKWRDKVCEGLHGVVVEIGFGSGLNVPHYPNGIELLYAVEPAALAKKLAAKRVTRSDIPIQQIGHDGQVLPLADESCDAALITFTLCTVVDPQLVLSETLRVLKPGGELHFLEHGRAPDPRVARWQTRLDPLEQRLGDGCHLTRDPLALVSQSGLQMVWFEQRYATGPKPWGYFTIGVAQKSSPAASL